MKSFYFLLASLCLTLSLFSQTVTTARGTSYSGSSSFLCLGGDFDNGSNINSASYNDFANFTLLAGVGCSYYLHSTLNGPGTAGTYAGFHVRSSNLLNLLTGIQAQTYSDGSLQKTSADGDLLSMIDGDEGDIYFQTSEDYDELRLYFQACLK